MRRATVRQLADRRKAMIVTQMRYRLYIVSIRRPKRVVFVIIIVFVVRPVVIVGIDIPAPRAWLAVVVIVVVIVVHDDDTDIYSDINSLRRYSVLGDVGSGARPKVCFHLNRAIASV